VLRRGIESYCKSIALRVDDDDPSVLNPGRIYVRKERINEWLQAQQLQTLEGSAHKNLFLQVSKVKDNSDKVRVRGVCPFNAAATYNGTNINEDSTLLKSNYNILEETVAETLDVSTQPQSSETSGGKCPFRNFDTNSTVSGTMNVKVGIHESSTSKCPAHKVEFNDDRHDLTYKPKNDQEASAEMDSSAVTKSESKFPAHVGVSSNMHRQISQEKCPIHSKREEQHNS